MLTDSYLGVRKVTWKLKVTRSLFALTCPRLFAFITRSWPAKVVFWEELSNNEENQKCYQDVCTNDQWYMPCYWCNAIRIYIYISPYSANLWFTSSMSCWSLHKIRIKPLALCCAVCGIEAVQSIYEDILASAPEAGTAKTVRGVFIMVRIIYRLCSRAFCCGFKETKELPSPSIQTQKISTCLWSKLFQHMDNLFLEQILAWGLVILLPSEQELWHPPFPSKSVLQVSNE